MDGISLEDSLPSLKGEAYWKKTLRGVLGSVLGIDSTNALLTPLPHRKAEPHLWFAERLEELGISLTVSGDPTTAPKTGPVLWIANHPFGGVDPIALMALALGHRLDTKVIGNELANTVAGCRPYTIPVDILSSQSTHSNRAPMLAATRHLRKGGQLVLFPSGIVAHSSTPLASVKEGQWAPHLGSLLRLSKATVIPVKFEGANSPLFHAAGWLHPFLRTALLPREFLRMRDSNVRVTIGSPIPPSEWLIHGSDEEITSTLREHTLTL